MKLISNFLSDEQLKHTKESLLNVQFPWYYNKIIQEEFYNQDDIDHPDWFMFSHIWYHDNTITSDSFEWLIKPIIDKIDMTELLRVKGNFYNKTCEHVIHGYHTDYAYDHMVALLNLNDNNGYTEFETGEKIVSKENELIIFDGNIRHRSVTQTDTNSRLNININFLK